MKQIIKIQKIFIAILLIINLIISLLSYNLQIKYIAILQENKQLKDIKEIERAK